MVNSFRWWSPVPVVTTSLSINMTLIVYNNNHLNDNTVHPQPRYDYESKKNACCCILPLPSCERGTSVRTQNHQTIVQTSKYIPPTLESSSNPEPPAVSAHVCKCVVSCAKGTKW